MSWTTEQIQNALFVSLGATVVILGATIYAGHKGKFKAHITLVGLFLVVFLVTVYFAELLGTHFDFEKYPHVSHPVHLTFAITGGLGAVGPVGTGFMHWLGKVSKKVHRVVVVVWSAIIVLALLTGFWMLSNATLRAEFGGPGSPGVAPIQSD
jgi:hypothetical protein